MKQETNLPVNEPTIEQAIAEYVSLEPDFQTAKSLRDRLRTRIIDHAKAQPAAFAGNEKSFHMGNGVVVRRATKTVNRFDADKMDSSWLRSILATPSAAAIKVCIDPKLLLHDEPTDTLLAAIDYREELQHSYKVECTTVHNQ